MKFPIPKELRVGYKKYKVQVKTYLPYYRQGQVTYNPYLIELAKHGPVAPYTQKEQFTTLLHEITHAVLEDMDSRYNRESFVKPFAEKLASALMSAKF